MLQNLDCLTLLTGCQLLFLRPYHERMAKVTGFPLQTLELPPDPPARDDPCWCRSQLPYGECHFNRHLQVPETRSQILRQISRLNSAAYCSHPLASRENCSGGIIRAHSLQRSGSLSLIAENGHVYGFDTSAPPIHQSNFPFRLIGLKQASTFTGFCARHDAEMFRALESQPFVASKKQLFLLAYRAAAKEIYAKRLQLRTVPLLRKGDIGREPIEQVGFQQYLFLHEQAVRLGLEDLQESWNAYQEAFLAEDFDRFCAYVVFADRTPEIAVSGGMSPECDFRGQELQSLASPDRLDFITLTVMPLAAGGVVAFIWDSKDSKSCHQLTSSLDMLPTDGIPDAVLRLTFEHFENVFANPTWWQSLKKEHQDQLLRRMESAASPSELRPKSYLCDDHLRLTKWKVMAKQWL